MGGKNYSAACVVLRAFLPADAAGFFGALVGVLGAGRVLGRDGAVAGRAALRRRALGAAPPRSARASSNATASPSVMVSGVLSRGSVALTPAWLT
jgi:hypothetical protein